MTKYQLTVLLFEYSMRYQQVTIKGVTGLVIAVAKEGGSNSFNVTIATEKGNQTVHIRTVD